MHACGHDNHMAILMGVATVLTRMRADLSGTVKFIFQPAEEGPGGAEPMVKAGVLRRIAVVSMATPSFFGSSPIPTMRSTSRRSGGPEDSSTRKRSIPPPSSSMIRRSAGRRRSAGSRAPVHVD